MNKEFEELIDSMKEKLEAKVKARNISYVTEEVIEDEISDAIDAVNERRRFDPTPSTPFEKKYASLIVKLALASISKYGAEGEESHSENGIGRTYDTAGEYPEALLSRIVPLAKAR